MNGVRKYTRTTVDIYFPDEKMSCRFCPLLETYSRNQCRRTGEYITDINGLGMYCPLQPIEYEEERT